jgi:hypothetical protein
MTSRTFRFFGGLTATALAIGTMAHAAMAHPYQPYQQNAVWPQVAVGRLGSSSRHMMSIPAAQHFCRINRGCRLSADINLGPGPDNWTSGGRTLEYFPNTSLPFDETGTGHNVIEVRY